MTQLLARNAAEAVAFLKDHQDGQLVAISLYTCNYVDDDVSELADWLIARPNAVCTVDLSRNQLTDVTGVKLARFLAASKSLDWLWLCHNRFGFATLAAMAWALCHNTSVIEFFSDRNAVAQPGRADPLFVHALRVNPERPDRSIWLLGVDYNNDYIRLSKVSQRLGHPTMQDVLLVRFIDLADAVS